MFPAIGGGSGKPDTGDIGHSMRFRRSASAYISTGKTSATTSTYFAFFGQGALDAINPIFDGNIKINANNTITAFGLTTSAVQRDPTAHHWIHVSNNGLVVDGVNLGAVTTSSIANIRIGFDGTNYADMYGSRICCVSGSSVDYTNFVYFNTQINKWVVKSQSQIKALVDAGDANSFMYDFDNGTSLTTLGNDKSSKGNNATLNNFSLTAGPTYDWMLDVPGNQYATLNPLDRSVVSGSPTIADGNLRCSITGTGNVIRPAASLIPNSGKWFYEVAMLTMPADTSNWVGALYPAAAYRTDGQITLNANTWSAYGASYTTNDVIGVAINIDGNTVEFFKNGVSQGTRTVTLSVGQHLASLASASAASVAYNFGQRPFTYPPPTGFKSLCQANLPDIPAATLNPLNHAQVKLDTGANIKATCEAVFSGSNCLEIIKDRANSNNWQWADIVRGLSAIIQSNTTNSETTYSAPSGSSVGLVLKANGSPVTNNAGSIQSQVSANVAAGFSIVTYRGTAINSTVGHGLPVAPKLIIIKGRTTAGSSWPVWHIALAGSEYLNLNLTDAKASAGSLWNNTIPTSSVFSLGSNGTANTLGADYVAYCFADNRDLPGGIFRCFSYAANASTDGTYVDVGGKVLSVPFLKRTDSTSNWFDLDTVRDTSNPMSAQLYPNLANAESSAVTMDACGTGIKFRTVSAPNDGGTYIGLAILGCHGKYS